MDWNLKILLECVPLSMKYKSPSYVIESLFHNQSWALVMVKALHCGIQCSEEQDVCTYVRTYLRT